MRRALGQRFIFGVITLVAVIATTAGLSLAAMPASASSSGTVTWTGNGTTNGMCAGSENLGLTVPDGQQAWLFILTSPGSGPFVLTTNLGSAAGTEQGNGSVHFILVTPLNAVLTSASAVTGTDTSVLTVSGCQFGAPVPTAATTTTTTSGGDTGGTGKSGGGGGTNGGTTGVTTSPVGSSTPTGASPLTSPASSPTGASSLATQSAVGAAPRPGIAFTGANVSALVAASLLLIGTGTALLLGLRWRRRRQAA